VKPHIPDEAVVSAARRGPTLPFYVMPLAEWRNRAVRLALRLGVVMLAKREHGWVGERLTVAYMGI
jgi:hypothetical protein